MRRVSSVWLPTWPTDRLRKRPDAPPADAPLVTAGHDGRRQAVLAADAAARAQGVWPGMPLAQARALVAGLVVVPAEPDADAAGLRRLAGWCLRYAPLVAADGADGIWVDVTGCVPSPLPLPQGGEGALMADLVGRLAAAGVTTRVAVADTPGAAYALARHATVPIAIAPPGNTENSIAALSITGLRLAEETVASLQRLGIDRIGQLAAMPRAPLARRFGPEVLLRLDQALGRVFEPLTPMRPPELITSRLGFVEPLLTAEAFAFVIGQLVERVCGKLDQAGLGASRLDLLFERVDGSIQAVRVGTARPSRNAAHLVRLLDERVETVDPGPGVEAMRLVVSLADRLDRHQTDALANDQTPDLSVLVDRLTNRLGTRRVWRAAPVESDVPERSVQRIPPVAPTKTTEWPRDLPRPIRLLSPPQPVQALALLPDRPPAAFTWRRRRFLVRRADGPERIHGEWWRNAKETAATRDYWRVEDEQGRRFWLYRSGDGEDPGTGDLRWFLHGIF